MLLVCKIFKTSIFESIFQWLLLLKFSVLFEKQTPSWFFFKKKIFRVCFYCKQFLIKSKNISFSIEFILMFTNLSFFFSLTRMIGRQPLLRILCDGLRLSSAIVCIFFIHSWFLKKQRWIQGISCQQHRLKSFFLKNFVFKGNNENVENTIDS